MKVGIPKSTFYFWKKKFETTGRIEFESRKPKYNPNQITDKKLIKFVEKFYKSGRGIKYIHGKIIEQFEEGKLHKIIGTSAIKGIIKRAGLYKSKKKITQKRYDKNKYTETIENAGEVLQIDTKYAMTNKGWAYQMTAIDLATRTVWSQVYDDRSQMSARKFFDYVIADCPFKIQTIQTDNGSEFVNFSDTDKLSQFELGLQKHGINYRRIPPATPRYNGCVERVHGTFERELYQKISKNLTLAQLQKKVANFTKFYFEVSFRITQKGCILV